MLAALTELEENYRKKSFFEAKYRTEKILVKKKQGALCWKKDTEKSLKDHYTCLIT